MPWREFKGLCIDFGLAFIFVGHITISLKYFWVKFSLFEVLVNILTDESTVP